jgi:hypothetical protein
MTMRLSVTPIKPGRLYAVSGAIRLTVIARHPCDAVMVALQALKGKGDHDGHPTPDRAQSARLLPPH